MTHEPKEEEIKAALTKLAQADIKQRQYTVAWCADRAKSFGSKFFAEILSQETDPICKWYSIRALGDLRAREYKQLLLDVLRKPDVQVGKSSLHRMCASSIGLLGAEMIPHIVDLLSEPHEATRLAAVDTLGEIGDPSAIPTLSHYLFSNEKELQLWAALSLGKIGVPSIPALVSALSSAEEQNLLIILDALVMIDTYRVIAPVAAAAKKYPDAVRFYFTSDPPQRALSFVSMLEEVISSQGLQKKKAREILSLLKSKDKQS